MESGQLQPDDRARLAALLVATGAFHANETAIALSLFDAAPDERVGTSASDDEFVGVFVGGRLVDDACVGPAPATGGTCDLYRLAVDPSLRRHGISRALMRDVKAKLIARGDRLGVAETASRADDAGTREFYARRGSTEAARVRDCYGPADDPILLTTRLTTRDGGVATR
jgi:GNAT superfamily N-acetyltransferase